MIVINCKYGFRTLCNVRVANIEEARKLREELRAQLSGPFDRWWFEAKDEDGNKLLGSND